MIFIAFVNLNTIVLDRTRHTPRDRFITRRAGDVSAYRHRANQVARDLFTALPVNVEPGQVRSFVSDCRDEWTQAVVISIGDVHQLMGQHADHSLVRTQTREKDRAEGYDVRSTEKD